MDGNRVPLFGDVALARRIERAEAQLIAAATEAAHRRRGDTMGFSLSIAGGMATFAERDSPFNKVVGIGFDGLPTASDLDDVEQAFAALETPVQVELSQLADPAVGALLTERGYRLVSFENVLGMAVEGEPERMAPPGVEIRSSDEEEFDAWLDVVVDGVAHPDTQGVPSHEDFPRGVVEKAERDLAAAGVARYVALSDGVIVAGAGLRIAEGVAQLAGAATAPAHRRQGIHGALLSARLADAAAAGCDIAVVTTQPGSKSQQNVQRQGFDLLYTRAVLINKS